MPSDGFVVCVAVIGYFVLQTILIRSISDPSVLTEFVSEPFTPFLK